MVNKRVKLTRLKSHLQDVPPCEDVIFQFSIKIKNCGIILHLCTLINFTIFSNRNYSCCVFSLFSISWGRRVPIYVVMCVECKRDYVVVRVKIADSYHYGVQMDWM